MTKVEIIVAVLFTEQVDVRSIEHAVRTAELMEVENRVQRVMKVGQEESIEIIDNPKRSFLAQAYRRSRGA